MRGRIRRRLTPEMVVALAALFVALGGAGYAATGGNFILGQANSASSRTGLTATGATPALALTNTTTTAGATALSLNVASGHTPFTVNSTAKVAKLNADTLDGVDSTAFVQKGVAASLAVNTANGVVDVTNTGTTNGVQGKATAFGVSGVYGQNTAAGGYGVAGRGGAGGAAILGDAPGGTAGQFNGNVAISGGSLQCSGCVSTADLSTTYIQGGGRIGGQAVAVSPGVNLFLGPPLLGDLRFSYFCPATPTGNNGAFLIYNDSGQTTNVFVDSGGANPEYRQMAAGDSWQLGSASTGDSYHVQAQNGLGILNVDAATVNRTSDCHAQVQGLLSTS